MAFSTLKHWRLTMQGPLGIRSLASTTTPKFAASVTSKVHQTPPEKGFIEELRSSPAAIPIGLIGVMVCVASCIGMHTAKQQLLHSPSVQITKTKRECVPEVDYADTVIKSANKFQDKSFLRKVGHIQNKEYATTQANPFTRSRKCETLKTIGVPTQED